MINPITLSQAAIDEVKIIMDQKGIPADYGLRVGVDGGGCAGVSYKLGFDLKKDEDSEFEVDGIPLYIEKRHVMLLMGVEVDFIENGEVRGFHFQADNSLPEIGKSSN